MHLREKNEKKNEHTKSNVDVIEYARETEAVYKIIYGMKRKKKKKNKRMYE